jgi:hypothetical protein
MMQTNPAVQNQQNAKSTSAPGTADWHIIETKMFRIQAPSSWHDKPLPSMDTYNGMLTDGEHSMNYEYGIMPDTFKVDRERYTFTYEIIDGRRAKIIEGERYGIAIDNMSGDPSMQRRFIMMQSSEAPMDRETALRMIRSIDFK